VSDISPRRLAVEGGQVISLTGSNFGPSACGDPGLLSAVLFSVTLPPSDPAALTFNTTSSSFDGMLVTSNASCAVVTWSDVEVTCVAPPGLDASVQVRVVVGGQAVDTTLKDFG
jgi:hypothetical protein